MNPASAVRIYLNRLEQRKTMPRWVTEFGKETLWRLVLIKRAFAHKAFRNRQDGLDPSAIYSKDFFQDTICWETTTAGIFAKIIIAHEHPASVVDIGCGCGIYLKALHDRGVTDVRGFDGSNYSVAASPSNIPITVYDLRTPLLPERTFDVCLCIEVAEHLEREYADILVETLMRFSDTVYFTAATPGQGGINHINEQPHSFWISKFEKKGFRFMRSLTYEIRDEIRRAISPDFVDDWVSNNLMIFKKGLFCQ